MFGNVIVGVDGGRAHDAIALAAALDTSMPTLVTAYPAAPVPTSRVAGEYFELLRGDAMKTLQAAREDAGVEAELRDRRHGRTPHRLTASALAAL